MQSQRLRAAIDRSPMTMRKSHADHHDRRHQTGDGRDGAAPHAYAAFFNAGNTSASMTFSVTDLPGAPVLELTAVSTYCSLSPPYIASDQLIELLDEAAANFARARQFVVVGVKLLVQHDEAMNLSIGERRIAGEIGVDLADGFAHQ